MHIHLLGYSESSISGILDLLLLLDHKDEVVIVKNMEVKEVIPFCPPGITYRTIAWDQWQFDSSIQSCMLGVVKPTVKKIVFDFFLNRCNISNHNYTSLSHPSAVIASTVEMGKKDVK